MDNNSINFHNIVDSIEHDCKVQKVKDSIFLLKRKMFKTNDLIRQYSESMKQIDHLKSNLEIVKKEAKNTIFNYKSAMDKIRELELKTGEDKQRNEKLINKINEYEINIAADKQTIQQLICKIKDMENKHSAKIMEYDLQKSSFEDQIKDLEHELKKSKVISMRKKKEKKIISTDFDKTKPDTSTKSSSDIGINVLLSDKELSAKCQVQDKCIMTDEFYNMKDDPYPLFCAKCEAHLPPDLTPEIICKTMSAYPKLIEKDLSPLPKKIYSPPCSLLSTYPDSTNRNEDVLSRISMPYLSPYNSHDSIVTNLQSQSGQSSTTTQICENIDLRNVNISRLPVVAGLSSSNLGSIPTAFTLSQNRNYAREDVCPNNLLAKHSSSIKEIERKIRLLESKMKKFRRLKKKVDNNSCCHRNINCKDDIILNSNMISIICKSMAEYYEGKRETYSKNKRDIDSEKCTCSMKKVKLKRRQQLNKTNACKNTFSCKIENRDKKCQVQNTFCNKTENATKAIDISQCEHTLSEHKNNSFSDINTSSTSLNDTDESDEREFLHGKSTLHSAEIASVKDHLTTVHLSADETYVSDNSLDKDNVKAIDNKTEFGTIFLSKDENSTDHTDSKIVDINAEKNEIKSKSQNIHENKIGEICASNNPLLSKDNVEVINVDNKTETAMIFLSNNEHSTDYTVGKIVDINSETNEIKSKGQNIHENKIGEICASDNPLSKDNVEVIDMNNTTETATIFLSNNEYSTDYTDGTIVDMNAETNEIKSKGQNIHEDEVDEIRASDNPLSKDNVEVINVNNKTETVTIFLSNNEHSTECTDSKIVDFNAEKIEIKSKGQNIHEDKIGEICASDNSLSKDNVEVIDVNNKTETATIFLSNDEHSTDIDGKIVDINAEENIIKSEAQNIHNNKVGEIYASDNLLNKDNIKAIDMDNQTEIGTKFLSNNENATDHADGKIIDINVEKNKIESKSQNIYKNKIGEIYESDLLSKDNIKIVDIGNQANTEKITLFKDENSTNHDNKITNINAEESKIKRKGQNIRKSKDKIGDRILKNIRNLKRKRQTNTHINKQENIKSCSDHNFEHKKLTKKLRIENEKKNGDCSVKSIINMKRNLDAHAESINNQEDNKLCSDDYQPAKKLRIAHAPKTSVLQSSINENDCRHSTIRNIATLMTRQSNRSQRLNLLTKSKKSHTNKKCENKNFRFIETNDIDNEKNLDLKSTENCLQNNDITLSATNIERISEFEKYDILIKDTINRSISMDRVIGKTSSNSDEPKVSHNSIVNDTANDLEFNRFSIPKRTCIITQSESSTLCKDLKYEALETIETKKEVMPIAELEYAYEALENKNNDDYKESKDAISNDESSVLQSRSNILEATRDVSHNNSDIFNRTIEVLRSPSPRNSGIIVEDYTNDNNMKESLDEIKNADKREETCINNETNGIPATETQRRNVRMNQRGKKMKFINVSHEIKEEFQTPMSQLMKYINQERIKKYKLSRYQITYVSKVTDKFVKMQLRRLINSAWKETIHDDIIEKLRNTCGPRIIAKCIVEFLLKEVDHSEALDKSFTPPAPLMTTFEQKIIALLIDLEVSKPMVIYFVQAAIEYNLFRLDTNVKTHTFKSVDSLTRIYVVLSRIQKDREKVRMMCCNALYCMGLKAITVLYTILTCWPEVLPNAEANKEILPKCIAFLISSQQIENAKLDLNRSAQKLNSLKNFILRFYKYNFSQETSSDIVKELMTALRAERINGLDTAIILIAKREGSSWTYKNIIQSALLPMIIKYDHSCVYSAFSLLGRLLRAFPLQDEDNIVKEISEQLCDLIKSGQGSHDQQEGIISALLSLSRHRFDIIAPFVINWMSNKSLRPILDTQLRGFINIRQLKFWKNYLN